MLEILRFVFSSFWIWLGTAVWLGIACAALSDVAGRMFSALLVLVHRR
jgi:hypothetical protein